MRRMAVGFLALAASMVWSDSVATGAEPDARTYVLAVIPSAPPVAVHTAWTPFVERIQALSGLSLKLKVYEKMPDFEQDLDLGTGDFVFVHPAQMAVSHVDQGYEPLVRGARPIAGVVFVAKDSPIREPRDLEGKEISFIGTKNICSIFARHTLAEGVRVTFKPTYAGSTTNVYKSVLLGKAVAGATLDVEFERDPEVSAQLRPLLITEKVSPHALAAHPRVPPAVRQRLREAVLRLAGESGGEEILKAVRLASPVAADYERDYRKLQTMDIRALSQWGQ